MPFWLGAGWQGKGIMRGQVFASMQLAPSQVLC
jgi:hypothetical protein